jgi:hypothetical protein
MERTKQIRAVVIFAAFLFAGCFSPLAAFAAEDGAYLAATNTYYLNPDTGVTDDGGSKNAAIGEGMCRSVIYEKALVELEGGKIYATVRVQLVSNMGAIKFTVQQKAGDPASYASVSPRVVAEDAGADTADYRFQIPAVNSYIGCATYVTPMGRDVKFYMNLSSELTAGGGDFVVSVKPAAVRDAGAGADGGAPGTAGDGEGRAPGTAGANADAAGGAERPAPGTAGTSDAGVSAGAGDSANRTPAAGAADSASAEAGGQTVPPEEADRQVARARTDAESGAGTVNGTEAEDSGAGEAGAAGSDAETETAPGTSGARNGADVSADEDTGAAAAGGDSGGGLSAGAGVLIGLIGVIALIVIAAAALVLRKIKRKRKI